MRFPQGKTPRAQTWQDRKARFGGSPAQLPTWPPRDLPRDRVRLAEPADVAKAILFASSTVPLETPDQSRG